VLSCVKSGATYCRNSMTHRAAGARRHSLATDWTRL